VVFFILTGAGLAIVMLYVLWYEIRSADALIGRYGIVILFLFFFVATAMGTGRQAYRDIALSEQKQKIRERTESFARLVSLSQGQTTEGPTGKEVFTQVCSACHQVDKALIAPSLREIASIHGGHPERIVAWAKAPGKKRPQFMQMPSMAHLGDESLNRVARYMLETGAAASGETAAPTSPVPAAPAPATPPAVSQITAAAPLDPIPATKPAGANADAISRGGDCFIQFTCVACHSTNGTRLIGPSLRNLIGRTEKFTDGTSLVADEAYVRESIAEPQKKVVETYPPIMPSMRAKMTDAQFEDLVAYVLSLSSPPAK
jgi:mono/diheme cytochrome c family protein